MQSEKLIVGFRAEKMTVGEGELDSHQQRFAASDDKKTERGEKVKYADLLVVTGGEPGEHARSFFESLKLFHGLRRNQNFAHRNVSR